jgi:exopolyphosphatase/guanosine-5'-triphosphate,3'-diphosphate pyrophosphatase
MRIAASYRRARSLAAARTVVDVTQQIAPRWEWRTFGAGAADPELARLAEGGEVTRSAETYVLGPDASGNVKLRDGLLDVKVLRVTDEHRLQRWEPIMKAGEPLTGDDVTRALSAIGVEPASAPSDDLSLEGFLELAAASDARVVEVTKVRTRFTEDGCMVELDEVAVGGTTVPSFAIESEDGAAVDRLVRRWGLGDHLNTSYADGLAWVAEGAPDRVAAIDVGTNSVKFHVAERGGDGWRALADRAVVSRLGEGIDGTGAIADAALDRTCEAIDGMAEEARCLHARAIAAVGTAAFRAASNREEVLDTIGSRTGVRIEVIDGEREQLLAYRAAVAGVGTGTGSLVVFDTGGGSSQFTFGEAGEIREGFSVPIGAVRITERFGLDGAVGADTVADSRAAIGSELEALDDRPVPDAVVGMGGAVTNLTAVRLELATYDPDAVQGATLTADDVDEQIDRFASMDAEERRSIVGLQPSRAEVILAGACIVRTILERLGAPSLTVSDRGLRHGLIADRFGV